MSTRSAASARRAGSVSEPGDAAASDQHVWTGAAHVLPFGQATPEDLGED